MLFDFDGRFTFDEFRRSAFRIKNLPIYGPVIHKSLSGPIPDFNYTEEDVATQVLASAAISATSGIAVHTSRAVILSRYTSPAAISVWALMLGGQAYGELTPEQKVAFDRHRYRSR